MTWPDYAIIATVLISVLVGFLRGFIKEVLSLVIWALAFFIAYQYGGEVAGMMEEHVALPSARAAMGFVGLFVSVLLVGGLLSYLIGLLVESTGLSGTDRLLGGVFGVTRGLAIVVGMLLIAGFTPIPADPWWGESALIGRLNPLVQWTAMFLPESIREQLDFEPKAEAPAQPKSGKAGQADHPDEQPGDKKPETKSG